MATPTVEKFLLEVSRVLRERNGPQLQDILVIEPPLPPLYNLMVNELRNAFPSGQDDALEDKCTRALPEYVEMEDGSSWTAFIKFMRQYFCFLRDVNVENLVETFQLLRNLVKQSVNALGHGSMGVVLLPTVIAFSRALTKLTIALHKKPQLIAHLIRRQAADESGSRSTLVDTAADVLRDAFSGCLNDRSVTGAGVGSDGRPMGKKISIYVIANLCLKLYFECDKIRSAEQIFVNIQNGSPPLSLYPASQRVTYLYYLGRYYFVNNHFYRAQLALQSAYDGCHSKCVQQRSRILPFLITACMTLGRFPSQALLRRPEAAGLAEKFLPICRAISRGDLATFRSFFGPEGPHTDYFLRRRLLLPLRDRCEVLVWRSMARKTFLLAGSQGDPGARKAPTFDLHDLLRLTQVLERRSFGQTQKKPIGKTHTNSIFMFQNSQQNGIKPELYVDPDVKGVAEPAGPPEPTMLDIESMVSSLIYQGFLGGFISHRQLRFAIRGAKEKGSLNAGFPNVWEVIKSRSSDAVPGWKRDEVSSVRNGVSRPPGPGMVIHLSGARPAGTPPM
ncbi:hypothetical protein L228DRAFT_243975 [Xylona heveae TC161]|uniref:PCI domain-containing protein n=1 Tax=Xylona heveae (strain CBS 132557 / TC161) TaxID=1328760 RepID=A0A165IP66_XYLHT|nr:hypothetical protein L228DRAFT_243975 [Xylona heveae TC161]KZF25181.1 hypothetical protein L228DRAFT_243975 [Xylona heveae TC161]